MLKAYKYRLYPTKHQEELLSKHFGAIRLIYNLGLQVKVEAYGGYKINLSYNDLAGQLTDLKKEFTWLSEVNSQSLQSSLKNLDAAYKNFFKKIGNFPKFKNKYARQSFQCPQNVRVEDNLIWLPKFREGIPIVLHREFSGSIKTVTISKTPTGKYFASILVDNKKEAPARATISKATSIGIDLGIKSFAILSDGNEVSNPKYLRSSIDRLKILQQRASRKKKGSNNRKRANKKVAILHEYITNQRKNFLHKLSSEITNRFDTICIEDLAVSNMIKNHKLALSITDASWSEFARMLEYKSSWKGKNLIKIGRWEPSSKLCSECGNNKISLLLTERSWICENCGITHNRDINAAKNILEIGLRKHSGQGLSVEHLESSALAGAKKDEAVCFSIL